MLIHNIIDYLDSLNCTCNKYIINDVIDYLKGETVFRKLWCFARLFVTLQRKVDMPL